MNWMLLKSKVTKKNLVVAFLSMALLIGGISGIAMTGSAREAAISVETVEGTAKRLEEFTIKVTIDSPEEINTVEAYLAYDPTIIEFVSSETSSIVGNGGIVRIADSYPEGSTAAVYELTFCALEVGSSELDLYDIRAEGVVDAQAIVIQSRGGAVEVVINRSEPTDARLNDLLVADGKLKPDFSPDIYEYSIKVPYEIEELMFSAQPLNQDSTVTLEQEELLVHGDNIILIKVTSPSGVEKIYTLNVYRALTEDEILEDEDELLENETDEFLDQEDTLEETVEQNEDSSKNTDSINDQENSQDNSQTESDLKDSKEENDKSEESTEEESAEEIIDDDSTNDETIKDDASDGE